MEHPTAAVDVWASDEHRIGLKPLLRRVWAPRVGAACGRRVRAPRAGAACGQRLVVPVVTIHPRYRWRSLCGYVHPASGRTQWPLGSAISVELFARSLAAFAQQVGAGTSKEIVLVLDQAGWHMSQRLHLPPHLHLVPLPPYTSELQPAQRWWTFSNTPLINRRPANLDELDTIQLDRCAALQTDPALVATIQSATHYHWWPAAYSPIT